MERRISTMYSHEQSTPADTWIVNHNLSDFPVVDVFVDVAGSLTKIIPKSITYQDPNTCVVTFSQSFSGVATVL